MATRDIASSLGVQLAMLAAISSDTDTLGTAIDTAHFDDGVMFFINLPVYSAGDATFTLQESDASGGTYTDVAAAKLITPDGAVAYTAQPSAGDFLGRIGCFSTKQFIKVKVTSSNSASYTVTAYAVKKGEIKPVV